MATFLKNFLIVLALRKVSILIVFRRNVSQTSVVYQSAFCFHSQVTDYWYANTGFDFNGQYSSWDFYFEEFDCSVISGYCNVIRPDVPDTLDFYFEGSR